MLLHRLPEKLQLFKKQTRTKLSRGTDGQATASGLALPTLSSTTLPSMHELNCLEPLPWLCEKQDFWKKIMLDWLLAQSKVPSATYTRPSVSTGYTTRHWMTTAELASFYNKSSEPSKRATPMRNTKKKFLCPSSLPLQSHKFQRLTVPLSNRMALSCSLPFCHGNIWRFRRHKCENIRSWIFLSGDLVFNHLQGIHSFEFPKRFLEISSRDLTSLFSIQII